jgi:hypothetical protein
LQAAGHFDRDVTQMAIMPGQDRDLNHVDA